MSQVVERYKSLGFFARLTLGGAFLVVLCGFAALGILLFGRPQVSVSTDSALAQVRVSGVGTDLTSVQAVSEGKRLSLVESSGGFVPTHAVAQGDVVHVTAVATPPSWLRWLLGGPVSTTKTLRTPTVTAEPTALTSRHGEVPVSFDSAVSVVDYRDGPSGTDKTVDLKSTSSVADLTVSPQASAGSLEVAASPRSWEKVAAVSQTVSWFVRPANHETLVIADPGPGASTASSDAPITLTFDEPVAKVLGSSRPKLDPSVPGTWTEGGPNTLVFTPKGFGFGPDAVVQVSFGKPVTVIALDKATGSGSLTSANTVSDISSFHFTTGPGSVLRLEEILAQLRYLPLDFVPSAGVKEPTTFAGEVATISKPLPGTFSWRWSSTPASLEAEWARGSANTMLKGALMAFEAENGTYDGYVADEETVNQLADATLWRELLEAGVKDKVDPNGYSYVYVSQDLPETLTIWENGSVVLQAPCNTGIPQSPTESGTFPIYVRYTFNYMSGFNPDGSYYHDPVYWINYFNGGDAVHGFVRASYGFPQSLGCVELPIATAEAAFGHLTIGDLVTVAP